jgi:hypothetical protein
MRERLEQVLIDRGGKIIVVENPALDFEAEHVTRSREAIRGEQTSRNFGLFLEAIGEAHKIVARKARRLNLFAHLTVRRFTSGRPRWPQARPFLGPISYPWDDGEGKGKAMIYSSHRDHKAKAVAEVLAMIAATELAPYRPLPVREADEWLEESAT